MLLNILRQFRYRNFVVNGWLFKPIGDLNRLRLSLKQFQLKSDTTDRRTDFSGYCYSNIILVILVKYLLCCKGYTGIGVDF